MTAPLPLTGHTIISFESRRATEMSRLLERQGAEVVQAPSLREVPSPNGPAIEAFGQTLLAGHCDDLILLTGVGAQLLIDELSLRIERAALLGALGGIRLCCRGPKPVAVLKHLGLRASLIAPEPNTWIELVATLDAAGPMLGRQVYVQQYGTPHEELASALTQRGAHAHALEVYVWALPEDVEPLSAGLLRLSRGAAAAAIFTSAHQVRNVLGHARALGLEAAVLQQLRERVAVASIGPVTTEALKGFGIPVAIEPEHPKMGHLALAIAADLPRLGQPA